MSIQTQSKIPFLDLKKQYEQIKEEVFEAIKQVCEKTAFSSGPFVEQFEQNFAAYCETKEAVAVNNGTNAVFTALLTANIKEGDEVIIPANTFVASAWGVCHLKAIPVFVDCLPDTWEMDPSKIEEKITSKTKAIVGVHLYGQPFDVDKVKAIADKYDLILIEDAAQAHGAYYKGKRVGGLAEFGAFSFYPGKNLGTYGEGGAVTTNNKPEAERMKLLRNHGSSEKYYHEQIGYNMRMGGIEGAVLDVKLKYIDQWNSRRKEIAKMYFEGIINDKIRMQKQPEYADSVYHLFVITTENRDMLMQFLNDHNVFPGLHYPVPCHLQKAFDYLDYKKGDFPNAEYLSDHCLSLPMFAELTNEDVERVIEVINKF